MSTDEVTIKVSRLTYYPDRLRNYKVLVDEIEMGLTGQTNESGSNMGRIFAFFLTWMQEKTRGLFVAATANRIDASGHMPIIGCGAGNNEFSLSYDGRLKLCMSLCHPDWEFDLRSGSLKEAWFQFIPQVLTRQTQNKELLERCGVCSLKNLCQWCPASAFLETGEMDQHIESFCTTANTRAEWLKAD